MYAVHIPKSQEVSNYKLVYYNTMSTFSHVWGGG